MLRKSKGFTLVEIMIVVAIIGLLAAIAIPNLVRMRLNANESSVKQDLRTFSSAAEIFRAAQNPIRFPNNVTELISTVPSYLDTTWNANPKHQYNFAYVVNGQNTAYAMIGAPLPSGGFNTYCVDQSGIIVGSVNGAGAPTATANGCAGGTPL